MKCDLGWEKILADNLISIKGIDNGYTKNHFFEFSNGEVSIRNLVTDKIKHVHKYLPYEFLNTVRKTILSSILERGVRVENCILDNGKLHLVGNSIDSFQKEILGLRHRRKMKANMIW